MLYNLSTHAQSIFHHDHPYMYMINPGKGSLWLSMPGKGHRSRKHKGTEHLEVMAFVSLRHLVSTKCKNWWWGDPSPPTQKSIQQGWLKIVPDIYIHTFIYVLDNMQTHVVERRLQRYWIRIMSFVFLKSIDSWEWFTIAFCSSSICWAVSEPQHDLDHFSEQEIEDNNRHTFWMDCRHALSC
jgi:hypothetical protein